MRGGVPALQPDPRESYGRLLLVGLGAHVRAHRAARVIGDQSMVSAVVPGAADGDVHRALFHIHQSLRREVGDAAGDADCHCIGDARFSFCGRSDFQRHRGLAAGVHVSSHGPIWRMVRASDQRHGWTVSHRLCRAGL